MASTLRSWRLALVSLFALGTAPAWAQEVAPPSDPSSAASSMDAELFYELLVGEMAAAQGDAPNAIALLMEAARQSHTEALYQRAAEIALQSRSGPQALMVATEWSNNLPQSRAANRYLLQVLLMLNRISESQEPLKREIAWTPSGAKAATYLAIAQLYGRASDKALAAAVVENALQDDLQQPALAAAAWATIGHLRLEGGQQALAMQALQHAYAQGPSDGATALLALELMEAGEPAAEALAQDYLQGQPAPTIALAYIRVLIKHNRWSDAQALLTPLLQAHPDMLDAWLAQAHVSAQASDWQPALDAVTRAETLLRNMPSNADTAQDLLQTSMLGGRIALQQQDYAQALAWLEKIPNASELLEVQKLKALALAKQGKLALGRALIRAVPSETPAEALQKRQAEVALLRESDAPQEAYLLQLTMYEQSPQDVDIAYETAILAERAGKLDAMEKILRGIIQHHPEHHHALNALGYSYADRGIQLHEAKRLVGQALALSPNDPFIQDSMGWVEFRLGNLPQALALLEQAYALRDDVEIAAHLGEVLWSMGEQQRARAIWRQALARDAYNSTLQSTLERLRVKP